MRLSVQYNTSYSYSEPARRVIQLLRLTPQSFPGQNVLDWRIDVGVDARLRESRDGYGNITHMLYIDKPVNELTVSVTGKVLTEDQSGVVEGLPSDLPHQVFMRETPLTHAGRSLLELASALDEQGGSTLDKMHRLTHAIHTRMRFETCATQTETTALEAFDAGHGVCQDFSHIFIAIARAIGIPSRYVSGHLFRRDGQVVQEAAHAWVEAWIEDLGWVAFDPSNGISADDAYIRIAAGLDYRDAAPFAGARRGGGKEELSVDVEVTRTKSQSQSQSLAGAQSQSQSQS